MKRLSLSILSLGLALCLMAQAPERVKYQSVVRDGAGTLIMDAPVNFRISVLEGSTSGPSAYTETHSATTNEFGLVNLEIGGGTVVSGDFSTIDWGANSYFFKLELDATGGTNYQVMGTSKALSVPYALYAATSASQLPGPQGPQGTAGAQGAAGAAGPAGATGPQGPAGQDGTGVTILGSFADESQLPTTGDPGDSYLIGGDLYVWSATANDWENVGTIQGPAGATGAAGPTGPPGAAGPQGPAGATGATGAQGLAGPQGTTGAIGATGPAGPTGPQGAPGATGPQGIPGTTGAAGAAGPAGPTGPQGADGADGSGVNILGSFADETQLPVTGAPGDAYLITGDLWVWSDNSNDWENVGNIQGPQGAPGAAGATGPQGPAGTAGATGPQGPAGPTGTAGAAGATGPAGPAGTPGATGPAGTQGPAGPAGSANINGTLNKLVKFTGATTGGNSNVSDDGTNVTVEIPTVDGQFQVNTGVATFTMVNRPNLGEDIQVAELGAVQRNPWISFKRTLLGGGDPLLWCQGMDSDGAYFLGTGGGPVLGQRAWTTLQNGNFGIGTTAPAYPLSVESDEEGHAMSVRNANNAGSSSIVFTGADGNEKASIGFGNPGYNSPFSGLTYVNSGPAIALGTQGGERMRITEDGAVGIGTSTPAARLEVAGNVRINDGTQGTGKVLTSDANGTATWQSSAALAYGLIDGVNFIVSGGSYGVESVSHPSTGNFEVAVSTSAINGINAPIACTLVDTNFYGFISYYQSQSNVVYVRIRDASGADADASFSLVVFGNP